MDTEKPIVTLAFMHAGIIEKCTLVSGEISTLLTELMLNSWSIAISSPHVRLVVAVDPSMTSGWTVGGLLQGYFVLFLALSCVFEVNDVAGTLLPMLPAFQDGCRCVEGYRSSSHVQGSVFVEKSSVVLNCLKTWPYKQKSTL